MKAFDKEQYAYGWSTDLDEDRLPPGLDEATVRAISRLKQEPEWMLDWRLSAFRAWEKRSVPEWSSMKMPQQDLQAISYFSKPKKKTREDIDPAVYEEFERLGIPLKERDWLAGVAVDAVLDSESVVTTHKEKLKEVGVIFCSMSEAVRDHPELVKTFLGSVVPAADNYWAGLNSAVFSDGSFVYVPPGVACPMELSTYFRINASGTGQFERTLIIADKGSRVSYLEGCTAPKRDENQLHAAVVELVALEDAEIKYSTVQNWYPGDAEGRGGILNYVTKRGRCAGDRSRIIWTQVETGSAVTWKYPSCILEGADSVGEFYSVAVTRDQQQADTGTKMIHVGPRTRSIIISKGISAGASTNTYRGNVWMGPGAQDARNTTRCDSLLIGPGNTARTVPVASSQNASARIEHEASTGRISDDQLWYLALRGFDEEQASRMLVGGFCRDVLKRLPLEFAAEADRLLSVKLEGAIG
jgi:Fe-S cluster assembly protein SufB